MLLRLLIWGPRFENLQHARCVLLGAGVREGVSQLSWVVSVPPPPGSPP